MFGKTHGIRPSPNWERRRGFCSQATQPGSQPALTALNRWPISWSTHLISMTVLSGLEVCAGRDDHQLGLLCLCSHIDVDTPAPHYSTRLYSYLFLIPFEPARNAATHACQTEKDQTKVRRKLCSP